MVYENLNTNATYRYFVDGIEETLQNAPPAYALLFPWFTETLGVIIFFVLNYFEVTLPYAGVMFVLGTMLGLGATLRAEADDPLTISILQWTTIDSDVLLLVFLPGLIFRDAIAINFNLFMVALGQILLMAFPMVLMGTALTASVAYYVLPYNWPWSLCMTLGSIMASTDPVAVSSLMKKAGAPPRLQMHLSGESLLNDGSAMVFYRIFTQQFLNGIGASGFDTVSVASGFALFFRMALGGLAIGLLFGLGLLAILHVLDRRMEPEYNVLQVSAALSMAYLSYFVADQVLQMSGVTACVTCGIVARAMGKGMIHQEALMDSYLALMEFLLNTLLFTLGGAVWGTVIGNVDTDSHDTQIKAADWGYLLVFYLLIMVIRFLQIGAFYPIFHRIGLGSSFKEAIFLGYGGLRGAVGIALAVSFSSAVFSSTDDLDTRALAVTLEYISGGVALLTLLVNGTTAGFLLQKLNLAKPVTSRKRALRLFEISAENEILRTYKKLIKQLRFQDVSYKIVKKNVPLLKKDHAFMEEFTASVLDRDFNMGSILDSSSRYPGYGANADLAWDVERHEAHDRIWNVVATSSTRTNVCPEALVTEMRQVFLELLDEAYKHELWTGELDQHHDRMNLDLLRQSVAFAAAGSGNQPLGDWGYTNIYIVVPYHVKAWFRKVTHRGDQTGCLCETEHYEQMRQIVRRAIAFIGAHRQASRRLLSYGEIIAAEQCEAAAPAERAIETILEESDNEVKEAKAVLNGLPNKVVWIIKSRYVCNILHHKLERFIARSVTDEVLTPKEAQIYIEKVKKSARDLKRCTEQEYCIAIKGNHGGGKEPDLDGDTVMNFVNEYNQRVAPLRPGEGEECNNRGADTQDGFLTESAGGEENTTKDDSSVVHGERGA
jgi:NhaP-type Na+/H+ or K+/H+ antiporter